jgi:hypothetical protein
MSNDYDNFERDPPITNGELYVELRKVKLLVMMATSIVLLSLGFVVAEFGPSPDALIIGGGIAVFGLLLYGFAVVVTWPNNLANSLPGSFSTATLEQMEEHYGSDSK